MKTNLTAWNSKKAYNSICIPLQSGLQVGGKRHTHHARWLRPYRDACSELLQVTKPGVIEIFFFNSFSWLNKAMHVAGSCFGTIVRITRARQWNATSSLQFTWESSPLRSSSSTAGSWQANYGSPHATHCCRQTHALTVGQSSQEQKKQLLFYMLCSASVSLSVYFCIVFKILIRPKIIYWKHFDFWLDKSNPTVRCTHLVFYEACSTS